VTPQELIIAKINFVIEELVLSGNYSNGRAADHFIRLKKRILSGKKLTKKMKENLAWVEKSVEKIK
jgi:hypothetical protein